MRPRLGVLALALLVPIAASTACGDRAEPGPSSPAPSPSPSQPAEVAPSPRPARAPCDAAALSEASREVAQRFASWSPRLGTTPDLTLDAVAAVWTHCPGLPDEARLMLDLAVDHQAVPSLATLAREEGRPAPAVDDDPLDARIPGHARHHEPSDAAREAAWAWRAAFCPRYAEVAAAAAEAPAGEREAIVWDRCAHRFDFVTREQYVATTRELGTVGFALHHWLTEAGVDDATADALARPVTLGRHWLVRPRGGLLLPVAAVSTKLEDAELVVELRPTAIHYGHRKVATIDAAGRIEAELVPSGDEGAEAMVGELYELLAGDLERSAMLAERSGARGTELVLLVVHRELPWSTLRSVLATAVAARARRVAVVGLADDVADPLRMVVVHDDAAGGAPLELAGTATVQAVVDAVVARGGPSRLLP